VGAYGFHTFTPDSLPELRFAPEQGALSIVQTCDFAQVTNLSANNYHATPRRPARSLTAFAPSLIDADKKFRMLDARQARTPPA
ncbi:MAG: hypothetical protein WCD76_16125, partial [Pyrinomonadaceae bacterium]